MLWDKHNKATTWIENLEFIIQGMTWIMNYWSIEQVWSIQIPNKLTIQIPIVLPIYTDELLHKWTDTGNRGSIEYM